MYTDEALTAFSTLMLKILEEGSNKYGEQYRKSDQLEFIREKLQRIKSGEPEWKRLEDLGKIATYAFLAWKKNALHSRVIAISSFTGETARILESEGLIYRYLYERDGSVGGIYDELINQKECDTLIMLGWQYKLPQGVLARFGRQCYNLHPGTLPGLEGRDPHIRALDEKREFTHATIHRVTPEIDQGPILMQHVVFIDPADTAATLLKKLKLAGLKLARTFLQEVI